MGHRRWLVVLPKPPNTPSGNGRSLEPLSRLLLLVAGLISLLLVGVLANSVLRGDGDAPELDPVASAAAKMDSYPGFRFNIYIVYSSPALPGPLSGQGKGAYDAGTDRTRMALSFRGSPVGPISVVQISDAADRYERSTAYPTELPPGKEWVRTANDDDDDAELDFEEALEVLSASGSGRMVERQSVNGKMTRHYRAEITIAKLVELLREQGKDRAATAYEELEGFAPTGVSAEMWVDRENLIRRMRFVMPTPGEDGAPVTVDMRMDLFGFGAEPDIQLPDPATVVDGPLDDLAAPSSASTA